MVSQNINVVLLSGGIDSAVCLKIAQKRSEDILPIFFKYGQQCQEQELRCCKEQLHQEDSNLEVIDMEDAFRAYHKGVMEDKEYFSDHNAEHGHSVGYVPQRNLQLLASATAAAERKTQPSSNLNLYFGAQYGDRQNYPDCRKGFVNDTMKALNRGTETHNITIETPLIDMPKKEVVEKGEELGVNWDSTVSCYNPPSKRYGCGDCPACVERREAFEEAGIEDSISYKGL